MSNKIKLFNNLTNVKSSHCLNIKELYLYALLREMSNLNNEVIATISLIDVYARNYRISFGSREDIGRKAIKELLKSLIEKDVINLELNPKQKANDLMMIQFNENLKGYTLIDLSIFHSITDMIEFYIYATIAKWKNGFKCSYHRWAEILQVYYDTAEKYVNQCVEKKIIYANVGNYNKSNQQNDINTYFIKPILEKDKTSRQKRKENRWVLLDIQDDIDRVTKSFKTWEHHYPNDHDYLVYLKVKHNYQFIQGEKEKELLEAAEHRRKYDRFSEDKIKRVKKEIDKELNIKLEFEASRIIRETNDLVLLVDGYLIPYAEWDGLKVDKVYGKALKFDKDIDEYMESVIVVNHPSLDRIELFRPKDNQWPKYSSIEHYLD